MTAKLLQEILTDSDTGGDIDGDRYGLINVLCRQLYRCTSVGVGSYNETLRIISFKFKLHAMLKLL